MSGLRKWFGRCECGHPVYDHGRIKPSGVPHFVYVGCRDRDCACTMFRASDGSAWPNGPAREREREPEPAL